MGTANFVWGVPTRAQDLKCVHCLPPRLSSVMGDICRILCSTINRSVYTLYWNISTFWINGAFITKLNLALLLEHPIYGITCVIIFSCNKPHVRYVSWSPRKQNIKRMASCIVLRFCCKDWDEWDDACWKPSALIKGSGPDRQSLITLGKHPGPAHI